MGQRGVKEDTWQRLRRHISVDPKTSCWNWTGSRIPSGYGMASYEGKNWRVHRLTWLLAGGSLIEGMEIDHTCSNPSCVNPAHLQQVTGLENRRRSQGIGVVNARRAKLRLYCKCGQLLRTQMVRGQPTGPRYCPECARVRALRRYYRRKARLAAEAQE